MNGVDAECYARQLQLLNDIQVENMAGGWECEAGSATYLWTDSMFLLHELPVSSDNLISVDDANKLIYEDDLSLLQQKRGDLEQLHYVDYYLSIVTPQGNKKRIHARERRLELDGMTIFRGHWQDHAKEKEIQQPIKDHHDKLALSLKVFERAEQVGQSGSWQINLETFETIYSDNIYRIYGLQPQSIPPHVDSFRKFIHPEDRAVVLKTQEKAYGEMIPLHLEYRITREDGQVRYINQASHLLKNARGEHVLSGSTRDVTEQKLLEIQLRESNEMLSLQHELFIQAEQIGSLGTWQVNMDTRKTIYSANLYRIYGLKPHSIAPGLENFIQYVHSDDREMVKAAYVQAFEEQVCPNLEFRITSADGRERFLKQNCKFIKNADGEMLMVGVVQDITDLQQKDSLLLNTNEKLAVQNECFHQAEKVAAIGSWTWNLDTDEKYYSDNVYAIYGLKPQSLEPGFENFGKFMHPDDRKRMKQMPEKIRSAEQQMEIHYRIIRADGDLRFIRSRSQPITSPQGHAIIIGTLQDVTEEVVLHQQLLEKIHFAETLSDTILDTILVTDTENNIVSWNKKCEEVFGFKKEKVLGSNFFDIFPQVKSRQVMDRFKKAMAGETIHVPVSAGMHSTGYHELFMVPFKDEHEKVTGILHVLHDITEHHRLQEQLAERLQFIEKLNESSIDRIMVLDTDLYFQVWNRQCEKYYGLTKEQVLGKNILEVFPKFKTDPLYRHCMRALENETVHVPANMSAGLQGYQESYFIPLKIESNQVTGVLWVIHDLTERFIAEQKLRTSEAHLKAAQEIALMGSFEVDLLTNEIKWSDQTYRIFDYKPEEHMTPEKINARIHAEDFATQTKAFAAAQESRENTFTAYFRVVCGNGELRHVYSRTQIVRDEAGIPVKTHGIVQDITEKKLAEETLRKQQELLRQAEEIAHLGSWELDTASRQLYWSDEAFRMYGYPPQSFTPTLDFYFETAVPVCRDPLRTAVSETMTNPAPREMICSIRTVDGETRHIQTRMQPVLDSNDRIIKVIGVMQDITDHKIMEDELREKKDAFRLQYLVDRQSETVRNLASWQWDTRKDKFICGEHFFRLFGVAPYAFTPSVGAFVEYVHPDDQEIVNDLMRNLPGSKAGAIRDIEFRVTMKEKIRYLRLSGRVAGNGIVVGSIMDVTADTLLKQQLAERVKSIEILNKNLEDKNKVLEEINEELTSFAFIASHDLREPLRKIQIFSDWLCTKEAEHLSPDGLDKFKRIQTAVRRMDVLIDDILSFSRISTSGKDFVRFDPRQVLRQVSGDMAEAIFASKAVITVDELPIMTGNPSQFAQLFQNLLGNALKYQAPGNVPHISITREEVSGENIHHPLAIPGVNYIKISFADNGIGFDEQYARKIFQMFQRLHGINEYPGTGMGLAICKKIVEHHHGFITASSKPGQGAIFDCYFPGNEHSNE